MDYFAVIVVLAVILVLLILVVITYLMRHKIRRFCKSRCCQRKKRVHEITAPVRPSGENAEIVLAVTQTQEVPSRPLNLTPELSTSGTSVFRHSSNVTELTRSSSHRQPDSFYRHPPPYRTVARHQSFPSQQRPPRFISGSEAPSPFISNLSSLQSLLMSSQVAIFNSSTERLSLSSLNQQQQQQNQLPQQQQQQGGVPSPLSHTSVVRSSSVHLPQPSYFDDLPPSYQQSLLIRKLRASSRSASSAVTSTTSNNRLVTHPPYRGGSTPLASHLTSAITTTQPSPVSPGASTYGGISQIHLK